MIIVSEPADGALEAGRLLCPSCGGPLRRWGFARPRAVRSGGAELWVRPRRGRCRQCQRTHVVLGSWLLTRRRDSVADVGAVLERYAAGAGYRAAARERGIPVPTVRNWIRHLRARWPVIGAFFDPDWAPIPPSGGGAAAAGVAAAAAAVAAVHLAAVAAGWPAAVWRYASLITGGGLLVLGAGTRNTS